jgi:hypothetical protein
MSLVDTHDLKNTQRGITMQNRSAALAFALFLPMGCPAITSVGDLTGGTIDGSVTITKDLDVGAGITGQDIVTETVQAQDVTVTGILRATLEAELGRVVAQTVQAQSIVSAAFAVETMPTIAGKAMQGTIAGVAPRKLVRGPDAAEASCAEAFSGSHICREAEFEGALRLFTGDRSTLNGAAIHVAPRVVGALVQNVDGTDLQRPFVINNCNDWDTLANFAGGVTLNGRVPFVEGVDRDAEFFGRTALKVVGQRVTVDYTPECAENAVELVCCL